jgi:pantoate--beta-alanine ligase
MEILRTLDDLARERASRGGDSVALVPTMGALHDGHLALVRAGRSAATRVIASVFVNPAQFGPHEDFTRYPRQAETDAGLLESAGCDFLFLPDVETIYPPGHATFVEPQGAALGLEGDRRPGHFRGVATVVAALFQLVAPDVAVFGEKDAQQLAVVRQMVRDLHLPVRILGHPIVRAADGVALSSRNAYLSPEERRAATVLYRTLQAARSLVEAGARHAAPLREVMLAGLAAEPLCQTEYAAVVDADSFQPLDRLGGRVVLPVAARVGATRLLDNISLTV